ncbi:MXAN_6652 family MXYO-CTERM-anchored protein [Hyalangium minutum]|uniref:Putative lipoprotein n=1 Tax=Hyalangium minutum TaxID=394096 RepID=A0A085WMD0_9BACT|nr:MXAN_6652 family MXYO-CTERM-anchored protein [Hyalangium minutum]KFE68843.1 putative lipoprotein [Hyalangium minutum]
MQLQKLSLGVAGVMAAFFFSSSALANSTGMTGRSGKTTGQTCMSGCHGTMAASAAPTVTLEGPATLEAGATGSYKLTISGGPGVKGGLNVAASSGTVGVVGSDVKVQGGELTHSAAKAFTSGAVSFDFTFKAPAAAGTATLYASGNSTNGDGTWDGDNAVAITKPITVTAASVPDAGTGTPDAGNGNGDGDGDDDDSGCSAVGGAPLLALLGLLAAAGLRRRSA